MQHVFVSNLGVSELFEKSLILIDSNLPLLSRPNGSKRVDNSAIKLDRICNKLRKFLNNLLNDWVLAELTRLGQELQRDSRTSIEVQVLNIGHLVGTAAIRDPASAFLRIGILRVDLNMIGHDKTGVESDTELANDRVSAASLKRRILIFECVAEFLGSRLSNCAKIVNYLFS